MRPERIKQLLAAAVLIPVILLLVRLASEKPDILETSVENIPLNSEGWSLFGGYKIPGIGDGILGTALVLIIGCVVLYLLIIVLLKPLRSKNET